MSKLFQRKEASWKAFFHLLHEAHLPWLFIGITISISLISSSLGLLLPDYTERIIDGDYGNRVMATFIGVIILTAVVDFLVSFLQYSLNARVAKHLREYIFGKILRLPIVEIEKNGSKELISRLTTDSSAVGSLFSEILPNMISGGYYIVSSLVMIGKYSWKLGIIAISVGVVQLGLAFFSGRVVFKFNHKTQTKLSYLTEVVSEVMNHISLIKVFLTEKSEQERAQNLSSDYYQTSFKAQMVTNTFTYLSQFVTLLGSLFTIIAGGIMVTQNVISKGEWVAYFMFYYYMSQYLEMFPYYWDELKGLQGTVNRLSNISSQSEENLDEGIALLNNENAISFEQVSFGYGEKTVLENISFSIPETGITALVGKNGAGKSTILGLIERFYSPNSGKITYGQHNVADFKLSDWRKNFAWVPQNIRLTEKTIRENLLYGCTKNYSDDEIIFYCQKVGLGDFITELPLGLDTKVEEFGENFSGGQRQKIMIVRAILRGAKYLILDEHSSNLDTESSSKIAELLFELAKEKAVILVSHKMSYVSQADNILVLNQGKIEAWGKHRDLLEKSLVYRNLYRQGV
ncbi:ABC transporter ATP-binding protein [Streptococcus gallolyticus]|uniref:ABC transporter ATP-binding protein n=1 Tax=Streptococcus gallolyticus TaxID=315405 RepID=A0AA94M2W6_9STRE|nr:ABC transporter ATP-binding protein [Streptococcus gallolyticus]AQP42033.1 ABC transporter ATP-binding protein/permease [Streptococcus gallolyticus subsp. gallolyticus DSM 16831]SQG79325.1 ABC transporter ATP-binding protein [Streptococcus gallolyticus]